MKSLFIAAIASVALLTTSCMENKSENAENELQAIFPKGEKGSAENFTGNAWNTPLVANDSIYNTVI
ncbi:MAG TPA: cupin domain-containing protein, partial [Parafilimonas sp.]|nr:cupin domain-containing protein [Parafilimonas sp.]